MKNRPTHLVLLSPTAHVLHDVSKSCPDLYIHQVNPATIPFRRCSDVSEPECDDECCKNVFISNWSHFQSLPGRVKRILKYARSVKPLGEITKVCIDVRARHGCEVIEFLGLKDVASLRLGQVHDLCKGPHDTIGDECSRSSLAEPSVQLISRSQGAEAAATERCDFRCCKGAPP